MPVVGSVVIVIMQTAGIVRGTGLVGTVGGGVGQFPGEGQVEAFDLAVRLGPVGAGEAVHDGAELGGELP